MDAAQGSQNSFEQIVQIDLSWPLETFNPFPDFEELPETRLLQYFQEGTPPQKEAALGTLMQRHADLVAFLRSMAPSEDATRDIFSETWLRVITNPTKYDPQKGAFGVWLRGIARNVLLEYVHKHPPIVCPDDLLHERALIYIEQRLDPESFSSETTTSESVADKADELVQRLLTDLKERYPKNHETDRQILLRRFFAEENSTEIGRAFVMTPDAVRRRLKRLLERLRQIAQDYDNDTAER